MGTETLQEVNLQPAKKFRFSLAAPPLPNGNLRSNFRQISQQEGGLLVR